MLPAKRLEKTTHLKDNGWRPTTISVFGIEETAWISPRNGKVQRLKNALLSQKRWDKLKKTRKVKK